MQVPGRKKTSRQKDIVDCARKIITAKGIENLTVRSIANELGVTDGALYRHFKSKKQIVALLIDDIEESLLMTIKSAASLQGSLTAKLESIFVSHLSYAEQRKGLTFIVINEAMSIKDPMLQKRMFLIIKEYLKIIESILAEGIRKGEVRKGINLEYASVTFLGMVQSLVTLWSLSGYAYSLRKECMVQMLAVYKNGVCVH